MRTHDRHQNTAGYFSLSRKNRSIHRECRCTQVLFGTLVSPLILLLFSCSLHTRMSRQPQEKSATIDSAMFNRTWRLAEQLARDDMIAWISTDSILAEKTSLLDSLDQTWFVYEENNRRYAFYGRYSVEEETYYPKYAFVSDGVTVTKLPPEPNETASFYAKVVTIGADFFKTVVDSLQLDIHYNHYIRKSANGMCTMWFFPAGYGSYCAQGIEVRITIDPVAGKVTGYHVTGTLLRYFELDKNSQTVELDNTYDATPSLGNIFFVLRNRQHFSSIRIINKNSVSTLVRSPDGNDWTWVHEPQ